MLARECEDLLAHLLLPGAMAGAGSQPPKVRPETIAVDETKPLGDGSFCATFACAMEGRDDGTVRLMGERAPRAGRDATHDGHAHTRKQTRARCAHAS